MASLNLSPNPTVMLVQAGLFLVNFVAVKKLILEPYLQVADSREKLTAGDQAAAAAVLEKSDSGMKQVSQKIEAARDEAREMAQTILADAQAQRDQLISSAEGEAKSLVEQVRKELHAELTQERAKLPDVIEQVAAEMFQQTIRV